MYSETTIRVYQAFGPQITDKALVAQAFVAPFKRERMTWIKPSFTWMMYRCGWAKKQGQERVLAIDISREGFEWALRNSCISHFDGTLHASPEVWQRAVRRAPVRIQWDPERTLRLGPLPWRTIQVGLGGRAVDAYLDEWIVHIDDVTPLVELVEAAVRKGDVEDARRLAPEEIEYPLHKEIAEHIGCRVGGGASTLR